MGAAMTDKEREELFKSAKRAHGIRKAGFEAAAKFLEEAREMMERVSKVKWERACL